MTKKVMHVHCDGACSGNPGPAGIGILMDDGNNVKTHKRYIGEATNNIAELTAINIALKAIKDKSYQLVIHTDSDYSINQLQGNWKLKANRELVIETRKLMDEFDKVEFVKIVGHSGQSENEVVDRLAVMAYEPYKKQGKK